LELPHRADHAVGPPVFEFRVILGVRAHARDKRMAVFSGVMIQTVQRGDELLSPWHVEAAGWKQEIDLCIDVEIDRLHARFLRVRSMSAVRSLLYSRRRGAAGSRRRNSDGRSARDSKACARAASAFGSSSMSRPPRITGCNNARAPPQHPAAHPSTSWSGKRKSCFAPGRLSLCSLNFAVKRLMPEMSSSTSL